MSAMARQRARMLLALSVIVAGTALTRAADAPPPAMSPQPRIGVDGDALTYVGLLNKAGLAGMREQLGAHPQATSLRIDSGGGDAVPALEIGKLVRARGLHVVVEGRCNSACANYIFVPASRRTISPGAMVVWHNSCPQNIPQGVEFSDMLAGRVPGLVGDARPIGAENQGKTVDDLLADKRALRRLDRNTRTYFRDWTVAHQAFYRDVPVDSRLMCLGDYVDLPGGKGQAYVLSPEDMRAFGLCDIELAPTYVQDVIARMQHEGRPGVVRPISLSEYPEFHPAPPAHACAPRTDH